MEMLRAEHISKAFDSRSVLRDVTVRLEEGELVSILGLSGSGKTTLLNIISGLTPPDGGQVTLAGRNITGRPGRISYMLQKDLLLEHKTVLDNVSLPLVYANISKAERRERAAEALEKVGLADRMDFYPNQISGGQQQRVAIARAMINDPLLLLADEPTGALDSASGRQVMSLFDSLNAGGTTVILITHAQEIADRAHTIRYILDGEFVEREAIR